MRAVIDVVSMDTAEEYTGEVAEGEDAAA